MEIPLKKDDSLIFSTPTKILRDLGTSQNFSIHIIISLNLLFLGFPLNLYPQQGQ